jgi:hypothetical protein
MLCPQCDSLLVERKPSANLLDRLSALFSIYPVECQSCKYRFRIRRQRNRSVSGGLEQRKADRMPARIPVNFEWGEGHGEGIITDISAGGCALESKRRLKPGLILRLSLPVSTEETTDRTAQQLVTVRSVNGDRAGVKFLTFTPQEQLQLTQTITRCIRSAH